MTWEYLRHFVKLYLYYGSVLEYSVNPDYTGKAGLPDKASTMWLSQDRSITWHTDQCIVNQNASGPGYLSMEIVFKLVAIPVAFPICAQFIHVWQWEANLVCLFVCLVFGFVFPTKS